jgi:site-specific DNA-methyltransferase (adenine-specific)
MELNKIYNGDILEMFGKTPDHFIDLIVTSPPYNVGIDYSDWNDKLPFDEYFEWVEKWLSECYRTLKPDGRIALNIPYEANFKDRGGRVFFTADFYAVMKKVGFNFFGMVDLKEPASNRSKSSAWGSWMSASGPHICNVKECVLLGYKESHVKLTKGESQWDYEEVDVLGKMKKVYKQEDKDEFYELVFAEWNYFADTRSLTTATFSEDIPAKAIKIMTYKDDLVLDCFSGSGTTALSAKKLGRNYIGFELSPEYHKISEKRLNDYDILQEVERKSKDFFDYNK